MPRPNILLITTDQQRFDGLALNGNDILRTPNLDAWAAGGVNFSRAYTTCPSCIAARRSILTGQFPATHGLVGYEDGLQWDPPFTLPGLLGRAGYQTQLIGKMHMFPQRKRYGFDNLVLSEQLEHRPDSIYFAQNDYANWLYRQGQSFNPAACGIGPNSRIGRPWQLEENLHHTSWMVDEAVDFLVRRRDPSAPWFLHLSFWAPHPPLAPPQAYWDRYVGETRWRPHVGAWSPTMPLRRGVAPDSFVGPFPPDELHDAMAGYYGLINHIDDRLAFLFSRLLERGSSRASDPTWVIFTSDHGEMLGDHQLYRKALPYEASAHVPFLVFGRNIELPNRRPSEALVCLEDILPTVCELAGAETPAGVDGRSLLPILRGEADAVRDQLHGEHSGGTANHFMLAGRHKYVWFARTNEEQLFDLAADPWELTDVSGKQPDVLAEMRQRMAKRLAGRSDYKYDLSSLKPLRNQPPQAIFAPGTPNYAS